MCVCAYLFFDHGVFFFCFVFLDKFPEMRLLAHMVVLFLILDELPYFFS